MRWGRDICAKPFGKKNFRVDFAHRGNTRLVHDVFQAVQVGLNGALAGWHGGALAIGKIKLLHLVKVWILAALQWRLPFKLLVSAFKSIHRSGGKKPLRAQFGGFLVVPKGDLPLFPVESLLRRRIFFR